MVVKLSVAIAFAAPNRHYPSIRAKLDDSRATLIHDIDRVIRANGDPARSVKSWWWTFPLVHDRAIRRQLLHNVLGSVRHVDIASLTDGDPVRRTQLSIGGSFASYAAEKGAAW